MIFLLISFLMSPILAEKVDIVIFSKDRPLQLEACCHSIEKFISPDTKGRVNVIFYPTAEEFDLAYQAVAQEYPSYSFRKQTEKGRQFGILLMAALHESSNRYIMFAVDDNIVKDFIDLQKCIDALEETNSYAFFLRLGTNINYCFMQKRPMPLPSFRRIKDDICAYTFKNGLMDWAYPNNVDMTIYRKKDVIKALSSLPLNDPWFESLWARRANLNQRGLFFEQSKIINLDINVVCDGRNIKQFSSEWQARLSEFGLQKLLELFNQGYRIDIDQFHGLNNESVHVCMEPNFIKK